jgi:hypothetical protein
MRVNSNPAHKATQPNFKHKVKNHEAKPTFPPHLSNKERMQIRLNSRIQARAILHEQRKAAQVG